MTNEQLWTIVGAYLGGLVALVATIGLSAWLSLRAYEGKLEAAEARLNGRIDMMTGELRQAVQYMREKLEELERRN